MEKEGAGSLPASLLNPFLISAEKKDPFAFLPQGNRKWHLQREEAFYIETTLLCVLYKPKKKRIIKIHRKNTSRTFLKKRLCRIYCLCATGSHASCKAD